MSIRPTNMRIIQRNKIAPRRENTSAPGPDPAVLTLCAGVGIRTSVRVSVGARWRCCASLTGTDAEGARRPATLLNEASMRGLAARSVRASGEGRSLTLTQAASNATFQVSQDRPGTR